MALLTTSRGVDSQYFDWLCSIVETPSIDPRFTHRIMLEVLHKTEFRSYVMYDENRIQEAIELRHEFLNEHEIHPRNKFLNSRHVTFLEVVIALARKAAYIVEDDAPDLVRTWFWEMLDNIDIARYVDEYTENSDIPVIMDRVYRVINRNYTRLGQGSLFPMKSVNWGPSRPSDMRRIELYYQLMIYMQSR